MNTRPIAAHSKVCIPPIVRETLARFPIRASE